MKYQMVWFTNFFVILFSINAIAQTPDTTTYQLDPVLISEKRLSDLPFDQSARNIQIITRAQLAQLPVQTLNEALLYTAGVDIRERGPQGTQADMSLMGGTFEQTLILINGIPMRDPQTGHHLMNLPVDIEQIERIEIMKGTAGRIYGANALAGAINIITKDPGNYGSNVQFYTASSFENDTVLKVPYHVIGYRVGTSFKSKTTSHSIQFSGLESSGYRYNTYNSQKKIGYQGRFNIGTSTLDLMAGTFFNQFGARDYYVSPYDIDAGETVNTSYIGARLKSEWGKWTLRPALYYRYNTDHYVFTEKVPSIYENQHYSTAAGAELHASRKNKLGQFGLGIEHRTELIRSNNLGKRERFYYSAYAEQRFSFKYDINITAGLNTQYNTDYGLKFYPGIEVSAPYKNFRLFVNSGMGSRLPSFTDLYYEDSGNLGNANLKPESALTTEGGLRYLNGAFQMQGSYFVRKTSEFIDFLRANDTEKWVPQNFQSIRISGLELSGSYLFVSGDQFLRPIALRGMYTNLASDLGTLRDAERKYVLNNLKNQLTGQFTFGTSKFVEHTFAVRYSERIGGINYAVADYRLAVKVKKFVINADITNIFNRYYVSQGTIPMPGRWFRLSVGLKFS
jgi:vitamin B12 transporter